MAQDLMAKSDQAAASARVLLDTGDADGACNRAYYAMFDAARAALLISGSAIGKTHNGVLNAFSDRLVKNGPLPKEMGRLLQYAETFRRAADSNGNSVEQADALKMVEQAEIFVAAIRAEFIFNAAQIRQIQDPDTPPNSQGESNTAEPG